MISRRCTLAVFGALALLVPTAVADQESGARPGVTADQAMPSLKQLIVDQLAETVGLRAADGVQIQDATFSRGIVSLKGSVSSAKQAEQVVQAVEKLRAELESTLDIKIKSIDGTGLVVSAGVASDREKSGGSGDALPATSATHSAMTFSGYTVPVDSCSTRIFYHAPAGHAYYWPTPRTYCYSYSNCGYWYYSPVSYVNPWCQSSIHPTYYGPSWTCYEGWPNYYWPSYTPYYQGWWR
jgi:hypothetical protein